MGMLGMHGNYAPNFMTNQCDLLIAVGMRFDDRITGNLKTYAKQAKIIHFDIDPSEINKNVRVDLALVGDCKETLASVSEYVKPAKHQTWIEGFKPYAEKEYNLVIDAALNPKEGPLLMGEVVRKVSEAANNEAVLVTDVGQNQMFGCRYFKFTKERSVITSGGCGTMGFGIPAAIGATFGAPDRTVCMFAGDGGFQMTIQELGTIMEQQCPVKMIMLNNNFLGNVRQWQYMFFDKRYSFTPMVNPDYEKIAAGYNIPCRTVVDRKDLDAAIKEMLKTKGPYLLQCAVKEEDNVLPMTPPGANVDEMLLEIN
jgi:acetolactate synthase-1/2/3 large subunit